MSWQTLQEGNKKLADFGRERFSSGVAYLATIRKDGSPRVHPITPIISSGRLFLFMEPASPKGFDLQRDGRYALHAAVEDASGGKGEFYITGKAIKVEDDQTRQLAARAASYDPAPRYILYELFLLSAFSNIYQEQGPPLRDRWKAGE